MKIGNQNNALFLIPRRSLKDNVCLGADSTADVSSVVTSDTNDKEDYCRPRPLSEAYLVPPVARPIMVPISTLQMTMTTSTITNSLTNYSIVPTPTPVMLPATPTSSITSNGLDLPFQEYMKMHPAGEYLDVEIFYI